MRCEHSCRLHELCRTHVAGRCFEQRSKACLLQGVLGKGRDFATNGRPTCGSSLPQGDHSLQLKKRCVHTFNRDDSSTIMAPFFIPIVQEYKYVEYTSFNTPHGLLEIADFPPNIETVKGKGMKVHKACALEIKQASSGGCTILNYVVTLVDEPKVLVKISPNQFEKDSNHESIKKCGEAALESFETWYNWRRPYQNKDEPTKRFCYNQPEYIYQNNNLIWNAPEPEWCEDVIEKLVPEPLVFGLRVPSLRRPAPLPRVNPEPRKTGDPKPWL